MPSDAARHPVRIKICGLRDRDAVAASIDAGADWLGFNFFARSPRFVTFVEASALIAAVPQNVGSVGLMVEPTDDEVSALLSAASLSALQIYATTERCVAIRQRFDVPVWQAVGVSTNTDLPSRAAVDRLVIEAKPPRGATRPGGNGIGFDWSVLEDWQSPGDWMLAGGLTPTNVGAAVAQSRTPAVDVASGVEDAPGRKDPALIKAFIEAARAASAAQYP